MSEEVVTLRTGDYSALYAKANRAEKAEAEVERLREALEEIAEGRWGSVDGYVSGDIAYTRISRKKMKTIARQALSRASAALSPTPRSEEGS